MHTPVSALNSKVKFEETPVLVTFVSPTYYAKNSMYRVCTVALPDGLHETSEVKHHLYNIFTNNAQFTKLAWHIEEEKDVSGWCMLLYKLHRWATRSSVNAPSIKSVTIYARDYADAVKFLELFDPSNLMANSIG